jgi:cytochrome o ubiquinol oxidase subunit 1
VVFQIAQVVVSVVKRNSPAYKDVTGDPWNGRTLEWATSSPPPVYNFAVVPVVHELDAFAHVKERGRTRHAREDYRDIHMPRNASAALFVGLFSLAIGFPLVWHISWLAIAGLLGVVVTLILRSYNDDIDYIISAETVAGMDGTPKPARTLDLQEAL